jgi:maltooligosyltrehalose trehalohydrolase
MRVGANYLGDGECELNLWGPLLRSVDLVITGPDARDIPMKKDERGYWGVTAGNVFPGCRYLFRIDGSLKRPDPASHYQPEGVHGPSELVDHESFPWDDGVWQGKPLEEMIMYELHVGTFTEEGTFDGVIQRIPELRDLGVNALEIMPVGQFPGGRNWGYDVAYPYSVQNSYGGPSGLKRLVNACHANGIAVILDVIYNHLGPEGNYLGEFAPYFSRKYKTPWGEAINFDGPHADGVRDYFVENALYWFELYHIDALRLDAIHGIFDMSARPFLQELAERVEDFSIRRGRKYYLIAESDLNDVRVIRPVQMGGYGIDAQWCDDFHHAVHTLITGEKSGYYLDFGGIDHLEKAYREGFVYSWNYSPYRRRFFGSSSADRPARQLVVFTQNHDQVGNRMLGDRLATLVPFDALKLAAGAVLFSPYIPLLFMGEEYGEESPFLYFTSHLDPDLAEAVRRGRKKDFKAFLWKGEPPDPQSPETFVASRLQWEKRKQDKHGVLLKYYRELISLRQVLPALSKLDKSSMEVIAPEGERIIMMRRWFEDEEAVAIMNFNQREGTVMIRPAGGELYRLIDSSEERWLGPGSKLPERVRGAREITMRPFSCALFGKGVRT